MWLAVLTAALPIPPEAEWGRDPTEGLVGCPPDPAGWPVVNVCAGVECACDAEPCVATLQRAIDEVPDCTTLRLEEVTFREAVVVNGRKLRIEQLGTVGALADDATDSSRPVFEFTGGAVVTLWGLAIDLEMQPLMTVNGSTVQLRQSIVVTSYDGFSDGGDPRSTGIVAEAGARVSLVSVTLSGGSESAHIDQPSQVLVDNSTLVVLNSAINGSHGGAIDTPGFGDSVVVLAASGDGQSTSFIGHEMQENNAVVTGVGSLVVQGDVVFSDNVNVPPVFSTATPYGAILWSGDLSVDGAIFRDNRATSGAAITWTGSGAAEIRRTTFCRNHSSGTELASTVQVELGTGDSLTLTNSRFLENDRAIDVGWVLGSGQQVVIAHNHFLGGVAPSASVLESLAYNRADSVLFAHNLVASNLDLAPVPGVSLVSNATALGNLWWDNFPGGQGLEAFDTQGVFADPLIVASTGECDFGDIGRTLGRPSYTGASIDAGSVGLAPDGSLQTDLDGWSRPDLGAWGGPEADPAEWVDEDHDGVPLVYDCHPSDPTIGSGLNDPPYDGVDSDCRANDDFDLDGDGFRPDPAILGKSRDSWSPPWDCDDAHRERSPIGVEQPANGLDDDCDGWVDEGALVRASCAVVGRPYGPVLWFVVVLTAARRRCSS